MMELTEVIENVSLADNVVIHWVGYGSHNEDELSSSGK